MKKQIILIVMMLTMALLMAAPALAETAEGGDPFQIDLMPLFQAVIALLASIVTAKLVPWIKQRTTADQQAKINSVTRTLVFADEQLYGSGKGEEKLWYVKSKLAEKGYSVDLDAIESAVTELKLREPWVISAGIVEGMGELEPPDGVGTEG